MTYTLLPTAPDDVRFSDAEYVVEASHTEIVDLWYRWGELGGVPMITDDGPAWHAKVAVVADREMVAWILWARVAGTCVAFVDLTEYSQVWARDIAETWQRLVFPRLRPPGAWRDRHYNAARFSDMLDEISGHDRLPMRSNTLIMRAVRTIPISASDRRAHMPEDSRAPLHTTDGNGKIPEVGDLRKAGVRAVYYHYECINPSCPDAVVIDVRTSGDRPSPCCTSCGIRLECSASTPCDTAGRASSPWMLAPRLRMVPSEGGDTNTDTNTEAR